MSEAGRNSVHVSTLSSPLNNINDLQYLSGLVRTAFKAVIPLQVIIVDSKGLISAPGNSILQTLPSSLANWLWSLPLLVIACWHIWKTSPADALTKLLHWFRRFEQIQWLEWDICRRDSRQFWLQERLTWHKTRPSSIPGNHRLDTNQRDCVRRFFWFNHRNQTTSGDTVRKLTSVTTLSLHWH